MAERGWPDERSVRDEVTDTKRTNDVGVTVPRCMDHRQVPEVHGDPFALIRGT